jgi:uncharacterized protein YdcH (DUF465 family)
MVDKSLNIALEKIVNHNRDINSNQDHQKVEKIERKIQNLLNDKNNLSGAEVNQLRSEALMFTRLADYADKLADQIEKGNKDLQKKKLEEVKKLLMEKLGVPADFIDQLAILTKAGPQALREASGVYRAEAQKRNEKANFISIELDRIDKQIKELNTIKETLRTNSQENQTSMKDYILKVRYQEALRDQSELVLKRVLEQMEGNTGETVSKAV